MGRALPGSPSPSVKLPGRIGGSGAAAGEREGKSREGAEREGTAGKGRGEGGREV